MDSLIEIGPSPPSPRSLPVLTGQLVALKRARVRTWRTDPSQLVLRRSLASRVQAWFGPEREETRGYTCRVAVSQLEYPIIIYVYEIWWRHIVKYIKINNN